MRRLLGFALLLGLCQVPALAAGGKFPYEAVVEIDGTSVHAGPGSKKYPPTQRLNRGDRVEVLSEDWGGWYKIKPPTGSYSWINAAYVEQTAPGRGHLTESNVVAYVGSAIRDDREVWQVQLAKGDHVEILGAQTFETDDGPVAMYKIKPPRGEYRWISGKAVVSEAQLAQRHATTPSQPAASQTKTTIEPKPTPKKTEAPQLVERPAVRTHDHNAAPQIGPSFEEIETERTALKHLDDQFRAMIEQEPSTWHLTALEHGYRQLQQQASHPALASQIESRLAAVERYSELKHEYDDFYRLASEAKQRDAQLLSLQQQELQRLQQLQTTTATTTATSTPRLEPQPEPSLPVTQPAPQPRPAQPSFDGAGIVQRSAFSGPGVPGHVLVAPNGRVLAYLHAPAGLNLDQYVGQALGIHGQRSYRANLQADLLVIRDFVPVRLRAP